MKFTLNWLRDHLDTSRSLDEICEGLVSLGHEVEAVSYTHLTLPTIELV